MIINLILYLLVAVQTEPVYLSISSVEVIDNDLAITLVLENRSDDSVIVYEPSLECMKNGLLSVELFGTKKRSEYFDLYPFDTIRDVDSIILTKSNTIFIDKGKTSNTTIILPLSDQKGEFTLLITLNYADVNFTSDELMLFDLLKEDIQISKTIEIR